MHILTNEIKFPAVTKTDAHGLLAIGGDLSVERLLLAYNSGIFPWYEEGQPIIWYSPDPRMVLQPSELKISKSMRQVLKKDLFSVTFNTSFELVMQNCANIQRADQDGTWITNDMITSYAKLHELGHAISVEVWQKEELVGGAYGVYLKDKNMFCGESMFSKVSNASKVGFIKLVELLKKDEVKLIDCQVYTEHLASLGAKEIPRSAFIAYLK